VAGKIEVVGLEDKVVTGNFDVTVPDREDRILHSKRMMGGRCGRAETAEEKEFILEQIREILDDE